MTVPRLADLGQDLLMSTARRRALALPYRADGLHSRGHAYRRTHLQHHRLFLGHRWGTPSTRTVRPCQRVPRAETE
jgi:hypothetical protein